MKSERQIKSEPPQGIDRGHMVSPPWHAFANPASLLFLGLILMLALFGQFGGQPHPVKEFTQPSVTARIEFPEILRNGEFFEMRAVVTVHKPVADLVIGVSADYWKDLTINSMIPAPAEESSEDGMHLFSYGPMAAGDTLTLKIDGQINPPLFAGTRGSFVIRDGDRLLLNEPVSLRVFP